MIHRILPKILSIRPVCRDRRGAGRSAAARCRHASGDADRPPGPLGAAADQRARTRPTNPSHRGLRLLLAVLGLAPLLQVPAMPPAPDPASEPDSEPAQSMGRAINDFGFDLWRRADAGNQALSPASIAIALDMTLAGARGETAAQMARVLHVQQGLTVHHAVAGGMLERWQSAGESLQVANRLFVEQGYRLRQPYLDLVQQHYGAPVEPLDFAQAPVRARERINTWVADQTRQRIRELIPPDGIQRDTRLVLTNAIWLLARWHKPFEPAATRPAEFFTSGGKAQQVPTMHARGRYQVGALAEVQLLQLPYQEADLAMLFVLPRARDGLAAVEAELDAERLAAWVGALAPAEAVLALPRFRIAPTRSFALSTALRDLGMTAAFGAEADFTGMAEPPSPADRLRISEVFHRAFVAVDEAGTEAAAATAVVMTRAGSAMPQGEPFVFRADHPFLFLLRDTRTGAVLFIGRVTDPAGS